MSENHQDKEKRPLNAPKKGKTAPGRPGKPFGQRKSVGGRPAGERKPFGRPAAEGGKPAGERKPFGQPAAEGGRPAWERKPFGRPAAEGGKPTGERKPFGPGRHEGGRPGVPGRKGPFGRPAPEKAPEMEGLAARRAALKVLREVTEEGAYASLSLDRALTGSGMSGADRRLVARLVYDTLDRLIWLDHMLSQVMAREDTDIKLKNILRLGACQILLEDRIPESAATNTCVQLCVELGMEGLKGVCNGILRSLVRKKEELTLPDPETEPDKAFAVRHSVPEWLGRRLRADWGEEKAGRLASFRTEEAVTIRRNLLKTTDAEMDALLGKKIWGRSASPLPDARRITGAMDLARDADFLAGRFSIQSESSMMACLAMDVRRGMQVLDCCAAPGGKTCYLAEIMGDTGRIQAWDIHPHRVALIQAQAKRLGLENIRPIVRDATKGKEDLEGRMDAVLLDAPCSGLGVMASKPDIKLRVTEEGLKELIETQRRLLDTAATFVKPGGVLVYSTCSILRDENENQIRAFLERRPDFETESLPKTIPEAFRRHEGVGLQLTEEEDGVGGFYICRMRRKEMTE